MKFMAMPATQNPKTCIFVTTDAPASQYLKVFTKNLDLRGQLPAILLGLFCVYGLWARSGHNDLVDHAHECYWRDVFANRIFGEPCSNF
jgi:hypothetical protein